MKYVAVKIIFDGILYAVYYVNFINMYVQQGTIISQVIRDTKTLLTKNSCIIFYYLYFKHSCGINQHKLTVHIYLTKMYIYYN